MNRYRFIVMAAVIVVAAIVGLALYTNFTVRAAFPSLPAVVGYLPADSQAVFGMNVQKFVNSPAYARFEEKHGKEVGKNLSDFVAETGVDPRRDVSFIVAGTSNTRERQRGNGVLLAVGRFNTAAVASYIGKKANPTKVEYQGTTVLMLPERDGSKLERGIAFLSESEIGVGDLQSLKSVLDVRARSTPGIEDNARLSPILGSLNPDEMFWFAGDAANILATAPVQTPLSNNMGDIQSIFGTVNLSDVINGNVTATAKDADSARKFADAIRGLVALGQLAANRNPDLAQLLSGVSVSYKPNDSQVNVLVSFPLDLLDRLQPHQLHR